MITIFNRRRKKAEYELKLAEQKLENCYAKIEFDRISKRETMKRLSNCISKPNLIKNLPACPKRVEIEFHIGVRKTVMFDGKNFIKPTGQDYRIGSIKCWREI